MEIKICKWKRDVASPVLLMIDDLSNTWIDMNGNGVTDPGEDWGYAGEGTNSSFKFLKDEILDYFPQLKVTFFIPAGRRSPITKNFDMPYYSFPINEDGVSAAFFKKLLSDSRFEMAYHGLTHGSPGNKSSGFIQEWSTYTSAENAIETINRAKSIFWNVFGRYPEGGKCPGYDKGVYFKSSVRNCGFKWWCAGISLKGKKGCDTAYIADDLIDIPTTLTGDIFNTLINKRLASPKALAAKALKPVIRGRKTKRLDYLLDNKLVINIQEHIAPARTDRKRQMPNIFDDRNSLHMILNYLKERDVWYCTAGELAQYCRLRDNIRFDYFGSRFNFNYSELVKRKILNPRCKTYIDGVSNQITVQMEESWIEIVLPDGSCVRRDKNGSFTFPVMEGEYSVSFIKGGQQFEACYTYR